MWKLVVATLSVMQSWNPSVWLISYWTEIFHLLLGLCSTQTWMICFHPTEHVMLPTPDCMDWNRFQGFWHVFFQCVKSIITIIMKILWEQNTIVCQKKCWLHVYIVIYVKKVLVYSANNALSGQATNLGLGLKAQKSHCQFGEHLNLHRGGDL